MCVCVKWCLPAVRGRVCAGVLATGEGAPERGGEQGRRGGRGAAGERRAAWPIARERTHLVYSRAVRRGGFIYSRTSSLAATYYQDAHCGACARRTEPWVSRRIRTVQRAVALRHMVARGSLPGRSVIPRRPRQLWGRSGATWEARSLWLAFLCARRGSICARTLGSSVLAPEEQMQPVLIHTVRPDTRRRAA